MVSDFGYPRACKFRKTLNENRLNSSTNFFQDVIFWLISATFYEKTQQKCVRELGCPTWPRSEHCVGTSTESRQCSVLDHSFKKVILMHEKNGVMVNLAEN
jgi:hypothetical protein